MVTIKLSTQELAVLFRQAPSSKSKGGWQSLMVGLQEKVKGNTLILSSRDLERIYRYAFSYGNGGWEGRLRVIFQRTLGPKLGRQYLPSTWAA